jgi:hypothetical protein
MLAPEAAGADLLSMLGRVSAALLEDEAMLSAVKEGDIGLARDRMEAALLGYLRDLISERLGL